MIRTLIFLLSLTIANTVFASEEVRAYTVTAPSGLSLRCGPGTDYDRLMIVPFNATVDVNLSEINYEHQDTIADERGTWYPVRYQDQDGYLFSAYLKYGHLYKPADETENINHDFRIVIPGIRLDALNYDPNLHWYALCKAATDGQHPLWLEAAQPVLDLNPLSWEESIDLTDCGEDVSLDIEAGEYDVLLLIGSREKRTIEEMKTYYNDKQGESDWGRSIYPYEQLTFWAAGPDERYSLSGQISYGHDPMHGEDSMVYQLGVIKNAGRTRYQQAADQILSKEMSVSWDEEEDTIRYVPSNYHEHPRLFWQGDLNGDSAPDLLFYQPNESECCGGSNGYYLLVSKRNDDGEWEWKRAADDVMYSFGGC